MNKTDLTVGELVAMISRGELRLPEMQRRYVWRAPRVRDLLDSLYRGYPSGAILVWETHEEQPSRDLAVEQESSPLTTKLLLDGQQRLTSLSAVLRGEPIHVRGRKRPIDILFNLDHPDSLKEVVEVEEDDDGNGIEDSVDADEVEEEDEEEEGESLHERLRQLTFVVGSKAMASLPNWVSVTSVMQATGDAEFLRKAGVTGFDDPRYSKYTDRLQRLRGIRSYPYVMHLLDRNLSYVEVAEIFVRVNSLGVKLRSSDLALAQITARWRNLMPLMEGFQEECRESGFDLDLGVLTRAMVVFASGQCRFNSVARIGIQRLQNGWENAKEGLRFAINFLRTNGGIEDISLLSSPFFILAIAYLYSQSSEGFTKDEERRLLEWVYVGSGRGYFSGSAETKLDADLSRIRKVGGPASLLQNLEQAFGRLRFNVGDIKGRGKASGLYALVFIALKGKDARDWKTGLALSLRHRGKQHVIQSHHIFPRARIKDLYDKRQVNEIANFAFIGGKTNRRISAALPEEYLLDVVKKRGEAALLSQCVPIDPDLWRLDQYPKFLETRRSELVEAVNSMLDAL
ncbi:MAG: DUF262 domain-containing protein [Planctomycetota bacterium]